MLLQATFRRILYLISRLLHVLDVGQLKDEFGSCECSTGYLLFAVRTCQMVVTKYFGELC